MSTYKLYHYWRSSCSWRVRFAFAHKGISAEWIAVDLLQGQSDQAAHLARNPMGYVPVLEVPDPAGGPARYLAESLAIIEYAEETHAENSLLPGDAWQRGRIRQLAEHINAGIQPLVNLGVGKHHTSDPAQEKKWNQHWIRHGLQAYETIVRQTAGRFSVGDTLTLADICLIPQCYSAARFDIDLTDYPTIARVQSEALQLEAAHASHPDRFAP